MQCSNSIYRYRQLRLLRAWCRNWGSSHQYSWCKHRCYCQFPDECLSYYILIEVREWSSILKRLVGLCIQPSAESWQRYLGKWKHTYEGHVSNWKCRRHNHYRHQCIHSDCQMRRCDHYSCTCNSQLRCSRFSGWLEHQCRDSNCICFLHFSHRSVSVVLQINERSFWLEWSIPAIQRWYRASLCRYEHAR